MSGGVYRCKYRLIFSATEQNCGKFLDNVRMKNTRTLHDLATEQNCGKFLDNVRMKNTRTLHDLATEQNCGKFLVYVILYGRSCGRKTQRRYTIWQDLERL